MRHPPPEEGMGGNRLLVHVSVERIAGETGEMLDVLEGDGARRRLDPIPDPEIAQAAAERMPLLAHRCAFDPAPARCGEEIGGALHRRPLQVKPKPAQAAELFPTSGASRPAMDEAGERRAVAGARLRAAPVANQDAPMPGGKPGGEAGGHFAIVGEDGGDQRAAARPGDRDRLLDPLIGHESCDRPERLDLVHAPRGEGRLTKEQYRVEKGAAFRIARGGFHPLRITEDELGLLGEQMDRLAHLLALFETDQRPEFRCGIGGKTGTERPERRGERLTHRAERGAGDEDASDRRAALARLDGKLPHHFTDEEVEFRPALRRIGSEDRRVQTVSLHVEPHRLARHHRMRLEPQAGCLRAGEGEHVLRPEMIEEIPRLAGDELQGALGQHACPQHAADDAFGDISGRGRRLDDGRHSGKPGGREFFKHSPAGEIEGVDVHRHPLTQREDVGGGETPIPRDGLGGAIEQEGTVGKLTPAAGGIGCKRVDPAIDVEFGIGQSGAGCETFAIEGLALRSERLGERLEHRRASLKGHRPQGGPAHLPRMTQRGGAIDAGRIDDGDRCARRGIAHHAPLSASPHPGSGDIVLHPARRIRHR